MEKEDFPMDSKYRIGHQRPSGSIEWLDRLYTKKEAMRQCDTANYVETGGRTLETAGHSAADGQDSGFRWVYEEVKKINELLPRMS